MSTEELRQEVHSLEFTFDGLKDEAHLNDLRERVSRMDRDIAKLKKRIAALRTRGYAFDKTLEDEAAAIEKKWSGVYLNVDREIDRSASRLKARLPRLESRLQQVAHSPSAHAIEQLREELDDFEDEIEAVTDSIETSFSSVESLLNEVQARLSQTEWMLDQLDAASFSLLTGESGIMACKAVWAQNGAEERKGDPKGILYLTDQRILFEQKEKVATKKVLFIATEKKLVQELRFEAPVAAVEEVREFSKGMLGKDDYLDLRFTGQAPQRRMVFHIWGSPGAWMKAINRAQRKDFDADRAIELDEEVVEKVRNAPSECPSCGATISQAILRGQDSLTCEYCGYVIRL